MTPRSRPAGVDVRPLGPGALAVSGDVAQVDRWLRQATAAGARAGQAPVVARVTAEVHAAPVLVPSTPTAGRARRNVVIAGGATVVGGGLVLLWLLVSFVVHHFSEVVGAALVGTLLWSLWKYR